jgi:hypothetical protein
MAEEPNGTTLKDFIPHFFRNGFRHNCLRIWRRRVMSVLSNIRGNGVRMKPLDF